MKSMIQDALDQMIKSNDKTSCELEGGAFCASFEALPTGEPWVQAKNGALNIYFPFERPPSIVFAEHGMDNLPSIAFPAWESRKFATVTFDKLSAKVFAEFIDKLFRELYGLKADYVVNTEVFDMR